MIGRQTITIVVAVIVALILWELVIKGLFEKKEQ